MSPHTSNQKAGDFAGLFIMIYQQKYTGDKIRAALA